MAVWEASKCMAAWTRSRGRRWRTRGFSHVATTIEAAAVMGWFVILILGEKYLSDATTARRAAENTAQQGVVESAMSYCGPGGEGQSNTSMGNLPAQVQGGIN